MFWESAGMHSANRGRSLAGRVKMQEKALERQEEDGPLRAGRSDYSVLRQCVLGIGFRFGQQWSGHPGPKVISTRRPVSSNSLAGNGNL